MSHTDEAQPAPRLLLDQNLSPTLVPRLGDIYRDTVHVRGLGLATASDDEVWERAAQLGLVIVTKDGDFRHRSFLRGPPPKVIWLRVGNCPSAEIERVQRSRVEDVRKLRDRS